MKISVLLSVYNGMPYLSDAVNSVLEQSMTDFEFMIIDDGSTDGTSEYLDGLKDSRLKIFHQENKGLGKPLNKWMKQCSGKYIMRLDADDRCHRDRLKKQAEFLEKHPKTVLVGCQYQIFSNTGTGHTSSLPTNNADIVGGMLKDWHTISHPTIMFRKTLLDSIEGYAFSGPGEDWSLLLDAARYGELAVLPDVLYYHRIHHNSNAWKGTSSTLAGLEYAQKRYHSFKKDNIEYSDEDFLKYWNNRSLFSKLKTRTRTISSELYREAILNRIEKKQFQYYIRLSLAALLDLNKTIGAIIKKIKSD